METHDKSSVDRIVGGTEEDQRLTFNNEAAVFSEQDFPELVGREIPKSPEDIEMLNLINAETDLLLEKYGMPAFDVPLQNIHFLAADDPDTKALGQFKPEKQAVFVRAMPSRAGMMHILFHEMVHFKSFQSLNLDGDETRDRRLGLSTELKEGDMSGFGVLNEAVTEELTIRFIRKLADHPFIKPERQEKERYLAKWGEDDDPELIYVEESHPSPGRISHTSHSFGYPNERRALNVLIDKLVQKNAEKFKDREVVFEMFASAALNGHLLQLAKLIEQSFGKGAFRKIAEFGYDKVKLLEFVESL